ncbi:MAG: translation initiation factor IF-3 [Rubrivivax sp.]|nr:translation initiation factor IF-3 [Pyrinomonadaceae bacterium]
MAGFRGRGSRPDNRRVPATRINDRIRVPQVRVIGDDGEQLGIMNTREAVLLARGKGLDLVEVAATADPPVCRIIDYGKFTYEAKKKASDAKKKQVVITVKEVKFRPGTDDHDYLFKMKHARQWLGEGDRVKATIFFRGREITHRELGAELLQRLEQDLKDVAEIEQRPKMEGNQMFLLFMPKKHKSSKQEQAKQESAKQEQAKQESAKQERAKQEGSVEQGPPATPGTGGMVQS